MQTDFSNGTLWIRPLQSKDIPLLFAAATESQAELCPWLPWFHAGYSLEETTTYVCTRPAAWDKGEEYSFGIFDINDGAFLGGVGLNNINPANKCANLGYWVRTNRSRQGIASMAARLITRFGLQEIGFQRLEIMAAIGNLPSQRAAEKAGAKREGVLRKRLLLHGASHDAVVYSFIAGDFVS